MKLYRSDNLDNPINSVSLGQSLFFHFPPLDRDGEVCNDGYKPSLKPKPFCQPFARGFGPGRVPPPAVIGRKVLFCPCVPELRPDALLHVAPHSVRLHLTSGHLHLQRLPQARLSDLQPNCETDVLKAQCPQLLYRSNDWF